ncbi:MAG: two-component system, OmpR family, sensor kinase [Verrucomicrobiota bacterium]|jgi:signal transduction histidine kinase
MLNSIKWRLQAWHGLLLVAVLGAFGVTAFQFQRVTLLRHIDQELQERSGLLLGELRPQGRGGRPRPALDGPDGPRRERPGGEEPPRDGAPDFPPPPRELTTSGPVADLFDSEGTNAFYYVIWRRDGMMLKHSGQAADSVPMPPRPERLPASATRMRGNWREFFHYTPPGECVLVGRWIGADLSELRRFGWRLGGAGLAVWLLGLAGGWWMAIRAFRPVEEIGVTASRISAGNLSERIVLAKTDDELGRLAGVLNSTFARLDTTFTQQQKFTADASHELRTPISVILNQVQTALKRERPAADYREALEACQRAAQRMRQLTESLLALARMDSRIEPVGVDRIDLADVTRECVDLLRPLADERRVSVQCDLGAALCCGDSGRLKQVVTNLLSNAIQHSPESGGIRVGTRLEDGEVVLTVTDQGPGVTPEALGRIFERFYRADESRNRRTGGVGLGLAIVKSCVEGYGGTVVASNVTPHGLRMEVRLPAVRTPSN